MADSNLVRKRYTTLKNLIHQFNKYEDYKVRVDGSGLIFVDVNHEDKFINFISKYMADYRKSDEDIELENAREKFIERLDEMASGNRKTLIDYFNTLGSQLTVGENKISTVDELFEEIEKTFPGVPDNKLPDSKDLTTPEAEDDNDNNKVSEAANDILLKIKDYVMQNAAEQEFELRDVDGEAAAEDDDDGIPPLSSIVEHVHIETEIRFSLRRSKYPSPYKLGIMLAYIPEDAEILNVEIDKKLHMVIIKYRVIQSLDND